MQVYASADLQTLFQAGIDVIANPQPGGSYWGVRGGINTSANEAENGDNYTRMTNYLAATLAAGMGVYVGQLINASIFNNVTATLNNFLANLLQQGLLGSLDGSLPYAVTCNTSNNPFSMTSLGYLQALVQVQYQAINRYFIVNLEGGQTVTIAQQNAPQS
jgi:phage tail sheath protein FI